MQPKADPGKDAGSTNATREKKRRRRFFRFAPTDVILTMAGLALAGVTGAFPFYVHRHPDQFGPPRMKFTRLTGEIPGEPEDRAPRFKEVASGPVLPELDSVTTGTANRPGSPLGEPNDPGPGQSFPGEPAPISILHAINGRAIVVDGGVINIVRPNSRLSDGSQIVDIRFNGKAWEIETSTGKVITWKPGAS